MAGSMRLPPHWRALRSALEAPAGDKLRPTDEQLVGMSWRLAREACGLTPPLMDGYRADGPLDDLRLPPSLPPGAGQAAQNFLREHWQTPGAVLWYNIANTNKDGLSGELGLPNSSQHDCRLCLRCIRREACAAVGKSAEAGFITQKAATGNGGHLKSKAHERGVKRWTAQEEAVSAAREQGKRSRDGELRGGDGQPLHDVAVEGVERIIKNNPGAQRRRVVDLTGDVLRTDEICAGPQFKLNGDLDIKSATGYFQKYLRSGPNDDRSHLTRYMVGKGEAVDVLEETSPTDDKLGFAHIRRRDGVSGWIHRCYLLAACREHDAQFQ
jgi:hypothetical protein|eukprot:COSAG01_NODE_5338_length_4325_cov_18.049219_1_plen_326_part_00